MKLLITTIIEFKNFVFIVKGKTSLSYCDKLYKILHKLLYHMIFIVVLINEYPRAHNIVFIILLTYYSSHYKIIMNCGRLNLYIIIILVKNAIFGWFYIIPMDLLQCKSSPTTRGCTMPSIKLVIIIVILSCSENMIEHLQNYRNDTIQTRVGAKSRQITLQRSGNVVGCAHICNVYNIVFIE